MKPAATSLSFEHILTSAIHMVRTGWKVPVCLFLQNDDGVLMVRAGDGIPRTKWSSLHLNPIQGPLARCFQENKVLEVISPDKADPLARALKMESSKNKKYVLVPVSGQSRVVGLLVLGPFAKATDVLAREPELRNVGALCAVLSAHWRLHEWMSHFLPEMNHDLRTPLTAVQGSIGMVLGGMFGQVGEEVREMLEMAQQGCERTVRAIESYLDNQKMPKDE